jgi:hypothetical protein
MANVAFDLFKKEFPEFDESLRRDFFQCLVCSNPPIEQRGFMVESAREGLALISVREPVKVICGAKRQVASFIKKLPERLHPLIEENGWYEGSVFVVMDAGPMVRGIRADKVAEK